MKVFIVFCLLWLGFTQRVSAQMLITEVFPAPSEGDEWIEFYNLSDQSVSLSGWKVEDSSTQLTTTPPIEGLTIPPQSFLVVEVKNKLNNTGDTVTLRKADLSVSDSFSYPSSIEDSSWARTSFQSSQFVLTSPTKGTQNIFASPSLSPSPQATPSALPSPISTVLLSPIPTQHSPLPSPQSMSLPLQISEVLACPDTGQPEWIEFYNPNGFSVSLQNWKVKDSSGNTRNLIVTLPAYAYAAAELSSAIFNNDGDEAHILDSFGNSVLSLELPICTKGESTVYVEGRWVQTTSPTRNGRNVFSAVTTEESQSSIGSLSTLQTTQYGTESASLFYPLSQSSLFSNLSLETPDTIATPSVTPFSLPKLMTVESEASPSADIIEDQPHEKKLPFYFSRPFLMTLFVASFLGLAVGGYGVYQWYTERRVEEILETL